MRKWFFRNPIIVWPAFMLVAAIAFVWSLIVEIKSAFYMAHLDSFAEAIAHAKRVTSDKS
jgi:capsular polysaccharide biosynthesis protein